MNRRLLLLVSGPTVLIGLVLFALCLIGAWYLNRLQSNLSNILASNVASMQAAQQLEIHVRQLRFDSFLYIIDPVPVLHSSIRNDEKLFSEWLKRAEEVAFTEEEQKIVAAIRQSYRDYEGELDRLRGGVEKHGSRKEVRSWAEAHPIRHVTDLCRNYAHVNEMLMTQTIEENSRVSQRLHWALLLLGMGGPLGGILSGFGIARGLSQSIYRLSVRVQDVAHKLVEDVATVKLIPDSDLRGLNRQLDHVVQRVSEVMAKFQRQQQEMLRAQQLAAVGQLAAGVAHEIRNPLTSIKMLVEAGMRPHKSKPMTVENLRLIHGEVLRLEQTIQGLLDFARPSALVRQMEDLRDILKQAIDLMRARGRQQGVQIDCEFPDRPVHANVDHGQMCNVFVNLFLNALDAMPQGGGLEIRLLPAPDEQAMVTVADAGEGIAPAMLDQLFTPFVSTKPAGSGLGLSICKRIVEEHQGTITANNRSQGGACFTVILPLKQE